MSTLHWRYTAKGGGSGTTVCGKTDVPMIGMAIAVMSDHSDYIPDTVTCPECRGGDFDQRDEDERIFQNFVARPDIDRMNRR